MKHHRGAQCMSLLLTAAISGGGEIFAAQQAAAPASAAAPAAASTTAPAAVDEGFSKEQLEQLVAPIALYADALLMQILMAATYPIEVVQADRFMRANPGLKDTALETKLKDEDWDPSVKSLCALPDVLKTMSENLDWTQDLGDAFLGQQTQLLDTVQIMRGKAKDSGNLKSTEQQVVTVKEEKIIVIESPSPEVVYVPTYSPTVVYGGWAPYSYYYPPMYPYYPVGAGLVTFGVGMAVGAAIWGGCHWGWGHSNVNVNVNRYNNFNSNTNINRGGNRSAGNNSWQHDASHRKGVNYQNSKVAGQYGGQSGSNRVARDQARGYSGTQSAGSRQAGTQSAGSRQARTPSTSSAQRQGGAGQAGGGQAAASRGQGTGKSASSSGRSGGSSASSYSGSSGRASAYSGSSSASAARSSSSRGSYSRGSASYGGSRGGGGMSRGGGGRRR